MENLNHKCNGCRYKSEHQEMGFRPFGVCTKETNLIEAEKAYKAEVCPFKQNEKMENLNAVQVKMALERCTSGEGCGDCPRELSYGGCFRQVMINALALINSQEQRIWELTEENSEIIKSWNKLKESHESACEKCRAEFKELTEENQRLRAENKTLTNDSEELKNKIQEVEFTEEEIDLLDEYTRLLNEGIRDAKAVTVQKYKSAIIEYYSKPKYQPTKEHPIKHTQIECLFAVLDQIAKEMLEGV